MPDVIYVLINEAMPGLVKIGRTDQSLQDRLRQFDSTGVPLPFESFSAYEVQDAQVAENALHVAFGDHRVRERREFFRISPDKPTAILKAFGLRNVTPGNAHIEDATDLRAIEKARAIKPRFEFEMAGVKEGATLHSVFDDEITCTVLPNERVLFRGRETSLTSSALEIALENGKAWKAIQGPRYWKHDDQTLVELRDQVDVEGD